MDDEGGSHDREEGAGGNEFFDVPDTMSMLLTNLSPPAHSAPRPAADAQMQTLNVSTRNEPDHVSPSQECPDIWDSLPSADDSLEQRFDFLFDWVQHAGFSSLDHLFEVWYTGHFSESSPLRQEQRLSRHRGLTSLLAKLRGCTHWSKWERWGYQEETLQGAESILCTEFSALLRCAELERYVAAFDDRSSRANADTTKRLERCLQDEVSPIPNVAMERWQGSIRRATKLTKECA